MERKRERRKEKKTSEWNGWNKEITPWRLELSSEQPPCECRFVVSTNYVVCTFSGTLTIVWNIVRIPYPSYNYYLFYSKEINFLFIHGKDRNTNHFSQTSTSMNATLKEDNEVDFASVRGIYYLMHSLVFNKSLFCLETLQMQGPSSTSCKYKIKWPENASLPIVSLLSADYRCGIPKRVTNVWNKKQAQVFGYNSDYYSMHAIQCKTFYLIK